MWWSIKNYQVQSVIHTGKIWQLRYVHREKGTNFICYDIKKARTSFPPRNIGLPDEILLSMASYLSWSPWYNIIAWDSTPITFTKLLQTKKEHPMLLFRPRDTCKTSYNSVQELQKAHPSLLIRSLGKWLTRMQSLSHYHTM